MELIDLMKQIVIDLGNLEDLENCDSDLINFSFETSEGSESYKTYPFKTVERIEKIFKEKIDWDKLKNRKYGITR